MSDDTVPKIGYFDVTRVLYLCRIPEDCHIVKMECDAQQYEISLCNDLLKTVCSKIRKSNLMADHRKMKSAHFSVPTDFFLIKMLY